jgi:hypothetical protein
VLQTDATANKKHPVIERVWVSSDKEGKARYFTTMKGAMISPLFQMADEKKINLLDIITASFFYPPLKDVWGNILNNINPEGLNAEVPANAGNPQQIRHKAITPV